MGNSFFNKINYSASNEDSASELRALQLQANDVVLCITGSGARSLDLLIDSPQKVISLDFNPTQNYLLALKSAAYQHLTYDEFADFIGLRPSDQRLAVFELLKPSLPNEAQAFWMANRKLIANGILYCGRWEKFLRSMLKMSRFRKKTIDALMTADSLPQQIEIWDRKWDNRTWKFFLKVISNRFLWVNIIREPGAKLIPKDFDVYGYMRARMAYLASHFDLKTNHYANLLFRAAYGEGCVLPHHLREEHYETIRSNLHRLEMVEGSLSDFLRTTKDEITAFSLSDFSSYAPTEVYFEIWEDIIAAAGTEARFCERHFLVKRNPEQTYPEINRNTDLENALRDSDEAAIYSFCAGTINPSKG